MIAIRYCDNRDNYEISHILAHFSQKKRIKYSYLFILLKYIFISKLFFHLIFDNLFVISSFYSKKKDQLLPRFSHPPHPLIHTEAQSLSRNHLRQESYEFIRDYMLCIEEKNKKKNPPLTSDRQLLVRGKHLLVVSAD